MGRFETTVPFYARTRPPYPPAFFAATAAKLGLSGRERLLDLGTGPGLLAFGFAPFVGELVGVDLEPAMLDAARQAGQEHGVPVHWVMGTAEALDPATLGRFEVVTIGRALHWMDPAPTRAALDRIVAERGSIAICSASSVADGRNPWLDAFDRYRNGRVSGRPRMSDAERTAFFAGTRFEAAGLVRVESEEAAAIEHLVDRVLSMSSSSPGALGNRVETLRSDLAAALAPFASGGMIRDITAATAHIFVARA